MTEKLKAKKVMQALILIIALIMALYTTVIAPVNAAKQGTFDYDLELYSVAHNADLRVTFTYRVRSGSDPAIKHWEIHSDYFSKQTIVSASEKHSFNPSNRRLRFTEKYGPDEERYVSFTLDIDYYTLTLTDIPYTVSSPPYEESGYVQGPGNPSITVPTASMTALQTMVPFTIAVGLISLLKKGMI